MIVHLITGEYPPRSGGVGNYTVRLAAALAARGCDVHVWCPALDESASDGRIHLHALPDGFGSQSRATLERALVDLPGRAVLQYVPNALGRRGANLSFCRWVARMTRQGHDLRVMFHEPYFYFTMRRPLRNALALVQRAMAAALLRGASVVYLSTETWIRYLRALAPATARFITMPIPSTLPSSAPDAAAARWRARVGHGAPLVGHFGTYGSDVASELEPAAAALLDAARDAHLLLVGHRSEAFATLMKARHPDVGDRMHASGSLPDADAAAALKACDLLLQPYPDGVTTRRTSVMAGLALGVATVTTTGALTEQVWHDTKAAVLVPASNSSALRDAAIALIRSESARRTQAARGKQVYEDRFAIEHAAAILLEDPAHVDARAARVS